MKTVNDLVEIAKKSKHNNPPIWIIDDTGPWTSPIYRIEDICFDADGHIEIKIKTNKW